jgi:hypothetical protein
MEMEMTTATESAIKRQNIQTKKQWVNHDLGTGMAN